MDSKQAVAHLVSIVEKDGVKGIQMLAAKMGVGWNTVYGWYRRGNVPAWRLQALSKAAQSKKKAA